MLQDSIGEAVRFSVSLAIMGAWRVLKFDSTYTEIYFINNKLDTGNGYSYVSFTPLSTFNCYISSLRIMFIVYLPLPCLQSFTTQN